MSSLYNFGHVDHVESCVGEYFSRSTRYIQKVLDYFGMSGVKLVVTQLTSSIHLRVTSTPLSKSEKEYMVCVLYASTIRSLMYVIMCTRPNLAQAISLVIWYMANMRKEQWLLVKHIFTNVKGISDVGLIHRGNIRCTLLVYSYLDHVGDLNAR